MDSIDDSPAGSTIAVDSASSRRYLLLDALLILSALSLLCVRAHDPPLSQTALSRLATVVALADSGVWYIDRPSAQPPNPFAERTVDKVNVGGRLISSKPPLMPWLMTWEYRGLRATVGWRLDNLADTKRILYAYTLTFCIAPWTLALLAASAYFRSAIPFPQGRSLALAAMAFGTQAFGFASVLNNHVPAAAALIICIWLTFSAHASHRARPVVAFVAGLAGGIVATFDVPNTMYVAALGILLLSTPRNGNWLAFGIAAAIPVLVQSWLLYVSTGTPLPVQLRPDTYFFESSYWRNPLGVDALSQPQLTYLFNMTFGNRGIFVLFPILCFGLAGFILAVVRRIEHRAQILAAGLCFGVVLAYYAKSTNNYGGEVYGMRWLIVSMPVLVLMGLPIWRQTNRRAVLVVAVLVLAVSIFSAWQCGSAPWTSGREWPRLLLGS